MKRLFVTLLFMLFLPALRLYALESTAPVPIEITSETMEADQSSGRVHFKGSVVAYQKPRTVYADSLILIFGGTKEERVIERLDASGQVRVVEGERVATAERMTYLRAEEQMILSGTAEVQQGESRISGDEIILYLRENRSLVKSGKEGRVRAVFLPQGEAK